MKEIKISVQSFTDIITNSSTEVFIMATDQTMKAMKEICQYIIGPDLKVDEVFDFKYECWIVTENPDHYRGIELVELSESEYTNLSNNVLVEGRDIDIRIQAKKEEYNRFAELVSTLVSTYETDTHFIMDNMIERLKNEICNKMNPVKGPYYIIKTRQDINDGDYINEEHVMELDHPRLDEYLLLLAYIISFPDLRNSGDIDNYGWADRFPENVREEILNWGLLSSDSCSGLSCHSLDDITIRYVDSDSVLHDVPNIAFGIFTSMDPIEVAEKYFKTEE